MKVEADLEFHVPLMTEVSAYARSETRTAKAWVYRFAHVPKAGLVEDDIRKLDFFGTKHEVHYTRDVKFKGLFSFLFSLSFCLIL